MHEAAARRALTDSALSLGAACVAGAMFLAPGLQATVGSWPRALFTGAVMAAALLLHWVMLGQAARRMGRPARFWVALAVLLFPVGGAAALILLFLVLHAPEAHPSAAH